jgi:hypothetical protein
MGYGLSAGAAQANAADMGRWARVILSLFMMNTMQSFDLLTLHPLTCCAAVVVGLVALWLLVAFKTAAKKKGKSMVHREHERETAHEKHALQGGFSSSSAVYPLMKSTSRLADRHVVIHADSHCHPPCRLPRRNDTRRCCRKCHTNFSPESRAAA